MYVDCSLGKGRGTGVATRASTMRFSSVLSPTADVAAINSMRDGDVATGKASKIDHVQVAR